MAASFLGALTIGVTTWVGTAFALPDDRAYELVSPPDTGAVTPAAAAMGSSDGVNCFETQLATPDGERVTFNSDLGGLEGMASNGVLNLYESSRTASGWVTESKSPTGQQSTYPSGGLCLSPDHAYSTLLTGDAPFDQGSLVIAGKQTSYIRTPGGSYALVGTGSVGTDQRANVKWIAAGGDHIIFTALKRLEPSAPVGVGNASSYDSSESVNAVYDRTPGGLEVISVLPSGQAPDSATEATYYRAASADGSSVVFEVVKAGAATLYEHRDQGPTQVIVTGSASGEYRYGGISTDGRRVVYLKEGASGTLAPFTGDIYLYEAEAGVSRPVITGVEATLVNLSDDGSHVYFSSKEAVPGSGQNPLGASAQAGSPNLYVWDVDSQAVEYVATVAAADVEENPSLHENLTEWLRTVAAPQQNALVGRMNATSRTTPDGSVFVFQARGDVTGQNSGGHSQIYRYDGADLSCVSCPAEGIPAVSDAYLQQRSIGSTVALNALARLANVSADGRFVFFMTGDPLTAEDVNDTYDVYQWKSGVISLISSGASPSPSVLYAMSANGRDVFFLTIDRLVPQDESSVGSIYDARIGGGFPPPPEPSPPCEGDSCQGLPALPPGSVGIGSEAIHGWGQAKPRPRKSCAKGKKRRKQCKGKKRNQRQMGAQR